MLAVSIVCPSVIALTHSPSTNFAKAAGKIVFKNFSVASLPMGLPHSVLLISPTTQSRCADVRLCLQYKYLMCPCDQVRNAKKKKKVDKEL